MKLFDDVGLKASREKDDATGTCDAGKTHHPRDVTRSFPLVCKPNMNTLGTFPLVDACEKEVLCGIDMTIGVFL